MPLIGAVDGARQDHQRAAAAIVAQLKGGYIREPHVAVEVEAYRPFFILGEVTTAGQYAYVNGLTVESAVAIAGGFSPRALKTGASVARIIDGQHRPRARAALLSAPARRHDHHRGTLVLSGR